MDGMDVTPVLAGMIDTWLLEVGDELDEMIDDHVELVGQVTPHRGVALVNIAAKFAAMHEKAEVGEINELVSLLVLAIDRLAQQREAS